MSKIFAYKSQFETVENCTLIESKYSMLPCETESLIKLNLWGTQEGPIAECTLPLEGIPLECVPIKETDGNIGMAAFLIELGVLYKEPVKTISRKWDCVTVYRINRKKLDEIKTVW